MAQLYGDHYLNQNGTLPIIVLVLLGGWVYAVASATPQTLKKNFVSEISTSPNNKVFMQQVLRYNYNYRVVHI